MGRGRFNRQLSAFSERRRNETQTTRRFLVVFLRPANLLNETKVGVGSRTGTLG
jgi:hypothetical protein